MSTNDLLRYLDSLDRSDESTPATPTTTTTATPRRAPTRTEGGDGDGDVDIDSLVEHYSNLHGVDPNLTRSLIVSESGGQTDITSFAGAGGIMQIMPETARGIARELGEEYSDDRRYDPETNIRWGTYLLGTLIAQYGSEELALGAYHGGPRAVSGGRINPKSHDGLSYTTDYAAGILARRNKIASGEITPSVGIARSGKSAQSGWSGGRSGGHGGMTGLLRYLDSVPAPGANEQGAPAEIQQPPQPQPQLQPQPTQPMQPPPAEEPEGYPRIPQAGAHSTQQLEN